MKAKQHHIIHHRIFKYNYYFRDILSLIKCCLWVPTIIIHTVSIDSTMICQDKWNTFFSSFNHVRYKQLKFKTEHLLHTIIHS